MEGRGKPGFLRFPAAQRRGGEPGSKCVDGTGQRGAVGAWGFRDIPPACRSSTLPGTTTGSAYLTALPLRRRCRMPERWPTAPRLRRCSLKKMAGCGSSTVSIRNFALKTTPRRAGRWWLFIRMRCRVRSSAEAGRYRSRILPRETCCTIRFRKVSALPARATPLAGSGRWLRKGLERPRGRRFLMLMAKPWPSRFPTSAITRGARRCRALPSAGQKPSRHRWMADWCAREPAGVLPTAGSL